MDTSRTTAGPELISKRRVGETFPDGGERQVRLKSCTEVRLRKGMFDEVIEGICHGASGKGGTMLVLRASSAYEAWNTRRKELFHEFRSRCTSGLDVLALMVDGVLSGNECCVIVALGSDEEAQKHLLDFEEASSENAEVVMALFARSQVRGPAAGVAGSLLLVRDGSDAIAKAVWHFWPDAVQQECLGHVERGLCGNPSWKHQVQVVKLTSRLRGAQRAEAGEEAIGELLAFVRGKNLTASENLESCKDGIPAFQRLDVPARMNVTFLSTNHIEVVMRNWRGVAAKVSRWNHQTDQVARWMGVALLRAQEGFRRVGGRAGNRALTGWRGSPFKRDRATRPSQRVYLSSVRQPIRRTSNTLTEG